MSEADKARRRVLRRCIDGNATGRRGDPLWSDGADIYSYDTCLLVTASYRCWILNRTFYNTAIDREQHYLYRLVKREHAEDKALVEMEDLPREITGGRVMDMQGVTQLIQDAQHEHGG